MRLFSKAAGVNPQSVSFNLTRNASLRQSCGCKPAVRFFQLTRDASLQQSCGCKPAVRFFQPNPTDPGSNNPLITRGPTCQPYEGHIVIRRDSETSSLNLRRYTSVPSSGLTKQW